MSMLRVTAASASRPGLVFRLVQFALRTLTRLYYRDMILNMLYPNRNLVHIETRNIALSQLHEGVQESCSHVCFMDKCVRKEHDCKAGATVLRVGI